MSDELLRLLRAEIAVLQQEVRLLKQQLDRAPERPAVFGRQRSLVWGVLLDPLTSGGSADVQLKAGRMGTTGGWANRGVLEDAVAPPLMPIGTCLDTGTIVCVAWFPLCGESYVIGASTCPGSCDDSSSG